jgi:hypothetical protein
VHPEVVVPIAFFLTVAVTAVGVPLARAFARRMDRESTPKLPSDLAQRMERMEHAIDSIAVEIERISEGQRFTTKLLSERSRDAGALPTSPTDAH